MRPGDKSEVVAILDTLPECKVVHDALEDPAVMKLLPTPSLEEFSNSTGVRFRQQTRQLDYPAGIGMYGMPTPGIDTWARNPEFKIQYEDLEFVIDAAQRLLKQRNPVDRLLNRITHRTSAAKTILKYFEELS
jgi:hypothetical protein